MGDQEFQRMTCKVSVSLPFDTPVVGCEIKPIVRVEGINAQSSVEVPPHALTSGKQQMSKYGGFESEITVLRHIRVHSCPHALRSCLNALSLSTLGYDPGIETIWRIPVKESYHCSTNCFIGAWKKHLERHQQADKTVTKPRNGDQHGLRKLRSCGSWPDFGISSLLDKSSMVEVPEAKEWVKVGSSKTYEPSVGDAGFCLRLESVAVHCSTGAHLSPTNTILTESVITFPTCCPRHMVQISSQSKSRSSHPKSQPSNDVTFSVLSYNILSDIYASRDMYSYCPTWALAWEYRRKNLLQEIDGYGADILCLQEVQSDHFEDFLKPELTKRGYAVMYKKKTDQVYTANKYIIDGCAIFYRRDRFKEIKKYELELDKAASSVVEALDPGLKEAAGCRLSKANVALIVFLEVLKTGSTTEAFRSRICVVAMLVHELEKIAGLKVPLLICGDMNSLPESDPYKFLVRGKIDSPHPKKENDPFGVYRLLNLQHSLSLKSAYASLSVSERVGEQQLRNINKSNREPLFTNFTSVFSGTLDYILYTGVVSPLTASLCFPTDKSLEVESLLELLDPKNMDVGLPSPLWSSDHIALMASFRLKPSGNYPSPSWKLHPPPLPSNPQHKQRHA
ncbi:unnamed protein product [Dovyalis caffra]|uniref:poly(A)-specific ribonuclease n=1 Tax=Dovyalis caffra TaxID=77055 RepID=A0AAV1S774_9ROSI|nr:unnamed protein product [Dovyalis caffra]